MKSKVTVPGSRAKYYRYFDMEKDVRLSAPGNGYKKMNGKVNGHANGHTNGRKNNGNVEKVCIRLKAKKIF